MSKKTVNFHKNVFINCPFDNLYTPLFKAIVFAVHDIGFLPRCALDVSNANQNRLNKIMDIISECKFSIHDLSRTEIDSSSGLPRFNMPLELGIDLGCKRFGNKKQREKVCLILDSERYRYQAFISDIAGQDIEAHQNEEKKVIEIVRNWLRLELDTRTIIIPGGARMFQRYQKFQKDLPKICRKQNWNISEIPFSDFSFAVAGWIENHPL